MEAVVRLEHQLLAVEADNDVHLMLELTPPLPAEGSARPRPPLRLALVLDRSGSMAGERLDVVKQAAAFLVGRLSGEDQVAVVDYDSEATLRCPLMSAADEFVTASIASIETGGMTNLSAGWLKGREQLAPADGMRRVLLLTDGLANQGITDPTMLADVVRGAAADGIGTTSIGVGDGFNEDLLGALAQAAGGNYHWIDSLDSAAPVFAEEFEDLVALVAQNVSVEIRPHEAVEIIGVLNNVPVVGVDGGLQIQLGDAYAGYPMRLVARLHAPSLAVLGPVKLADLVLRYVAVGDQITQHEVTLPVVANIVNADEAANAVPDAKVTEHVVILTAAKAAEEATRLADAGRLEEARRHLDQAAATLRATAPASPQADALLAQADELAHSAQMMAAPTTFDATERKRLHRDSHRRSTGRRPRGSA